MSDSKSFNNMPCTFTALVISSLPFACYLSESYACGYPEYNQQHNFTAASESHPLDDTVKCTSIESNSEYNSPSLPTTTQLPGGYRTGIQKSFTKMEMPSGLFASLTPRSYLGVLTRDLILTCPSRTLCDDVRARPYANPFQLSEGETVTGSSTLSDKSSRADEEKTGKNRIESVKAETGTRNTVTTGLKSLSVATARPLKALYACAPNNLALSSMYRFSRLITRCYSTERPREANVISYSSSAQCFNRNRPFRFRNLDSEDTIINNYTDAGSTSSKIEPVTNEFLLHSTLSVLFIPWLLIMSAAVIFEGNTLG